MTETITPTLDPEIEVGVETESEEEEEMGNVVLFRIPSYGVSMPTGLTSAQFGDDARTYQATGKFIDIEGDVMLSSKEVACELSLAIILSGNPDKLPWK